MTPERWREVKGALAVVLDCDAAERPACLDRVCGEDAELRREVVSLLAAHDAADDSAGGFLDRPAIQDAHPSAFRAAGGGEDLRARLDRALGDRYAIERELAGGRTSRVFVATERALDRQVVVKLLSPDMAAGLSVDRFKREITLAARLQHANIVPLLSAGDIDGLPYYTMPFVDGPSLRTRLDGAAGGGLATDDAVSVLRDVARALAYAHDRGVVHRDIKPDNILSAGGAAVVTDFGIAKALSAARSGGNDGGEDSRSATLTELGTTLGTPGYMAPEQAAADPAMDHRADLYAFGCTAYELFAGQPPFHGRSLRQLVAAHALESPPPLATVRPALPPPLVALVMRCLEKTPDRRPSAAEVARALDGGVTTGETLAVRPPPPPPVAPAGDTPTVRPGRAMVVAGVVALAAVALIAALLAR